MKIAMCALCKNEMKYIESYLYRNRDTDYICILDTGSTDGTWEYLQEQAKINPKLIIQQKTYDFFRFDYARNDSLKLLPNDVDLIVQLDLDEYFYQENWVDILKENAIKDGNKKYIYNTWYVNSTYYLVSDFASLAMAIRIFTPGYKYYNCVHEALSDADEMFYGFSDGAVIFFNDLLIIHDQDNTKSRQFYIDLLKLRLEERQPILQLYPDLQELQDLDSVLCLITEYYKSGQYDEALELYSKYYNKVKDDMTALTYIYLITGNVDCLREYIVYEVDGRKEFIDNLGLIYYSLVNDFEWCRPHKASIMNNIKRYREAVPAQYLSFDKLYLKVNELAQQL